jgi:hypothetical protein
VARTWRDEAVCSEAKEGESTAEEQRRRWAGGGGEGREQRGKERGVSALHADGEEGDAPCERGVESLGAHATRRLRARTGVMSCYVVAWEMRSGERGGEATRGGREQQIPVARATVEVNEGRWTAVVRRAAHMVSICECHVCTLGERRHQYRSVKVHEQRCVEQQRRTCRMRRKQKPPQRRRRRR